MFQVLNSCCASIVLVDTAEAASWKASWRDVGSVEDAGSAVAWLGA